ncbi:hypothetical protein TIFTF001_021785 [Ficus carica]|uniref:Uncharacterized protein n=1 Tax=Ficus carica TaxID=3494 RepID=A0AA88DJV5_FICCA|nr:hypothetical protein TIFTF001_021785 [Ficus carica]
MEGRREDCYRKGKKAEKRALKDEEAKKKAKNDTSEVFPATLNQAGKYAIAVYENSLEYEALLLTKYKEGMKDIKASFTLANPNLIGLNWSFMPKISKETQVGNGHGAIVWVAEQSVVVVEELETTTEPRVTEQVDTRANPPSELSTAHLLLSASHCKNPISSPSSLWTPGIMWSARANQVDRSWT